MCGNKAILRDVALRSLVAAQSEEGFSSHLLLFIKASVERMGNSVTAAAITPALGYD